MPDSALSPTVQFDLSNKVAVITGASKGIGESIARLLAAGAKVVVSSRKQDAVDEVAGSIRAAGVRLSALRPHVGDMAQVKMLADKTLDCTAALTSGQQRCH
jgi:NAD(P)-dependent dehydrogenase (short-subunit alcohol dehydrogenase family)